MSTDQPDSKKLPEGHIDLKKAMVGLGDKSLSPKTAAAGATENWQAELAKVQLPPTVKVTLAHPQPKPGEQTHLPMVQASAHTDAPTTPAPVAPKSKSEVAPASKPAQSEGMFDSALHWTKNAISTVKNADYGKIMSGVSATDFTPAAVVQSVYEGVHNSDGRSLATMAVVVVAGTALHKVGGEALEKIGLTKLLGSEKGVAGEILGAERGTEAAITRPVVRAASREVDAGFQSFGAQLEAANSTAALEFGSTRLTTSEGLAIKRTTVADASHVTVRPAAPASLDGGRVTLRSSSTPVLDGPLTRPAGSLNAATPFRVNEPGVPKIPVGLKPVEAGKPLIAANRLPRLTEFGAEPPHTLQIRESLAESPRPAVALEGRPAASPIAHSVEAPTHIVEPRPAARPVVEAQRVASPAHLDAGRVADAPHANVDVRIRVAEAKLQVVEGKLPVVEGKLPVVEPPARVGEPLAHETHSPVAADASAAGRTPARVVEPPRDAVGTATPHAESAPVRETLSGREPQTPGRAPVANDGPAKTEITPSRQAATTGDAASLSAREPGSVSTAPREAGTPSVRLQPTDANPLRTGIQELGSSESRIPSTADVLPQTLPAIKPSVLGRDAENLGGRNALDFEPKPNADLTPRTTPTVSASAKFTSPAEAMTEARAVSAQTSTEVRALQTVPAISEQAAATARTLEADLKKMSATGSESLSAGARAQTMTGIESGLKNLKTEVQDVAAARPSLDGIENGVTRLRAANDSFVAASAADASRVAAREVQTVVQSLPAADRQIVQSLNSSLERLAAPEATAVERRAALNELSADVEKLRPTTEPAKFRALEQQVTELRQANAVAEHAAVQESFETGAKQIGEAAKTARQALGSESGQAAGALERLEQNSNKLVDTSRTASAVERQTAISEMESDIRSLRGTPAASEVPQLERELAALKASENSLNLIKSEAAFAETTPKFASAIDEALTRPGLTAAQRAELESLKATATRLEPSSYTALNAQQQERLWTEAQARVATVERELGEGNTLRQSLDQAKSRADELAQARRAVASDEASASSKVQSASATEPVRPGSVPLASDQPVTARPAEGLTSAAPATDPKLQGRVSESMAPEPPLARDPVVPAEKPPLAAEPTGTARRTTADVSSEPAGTPVVARPAQVAAETEGTLTARTNLAASESEATLGARGTTSAAEATESRAARQAIDVTGESRAAGTASEAAAERRAVSTEQATEPRMKLADSDAPVTASAAKRAELVTDSQARVEQSTTALSRSVDTATEMNQAGRIPGDVVVADRSLAAMRKELDDAAAVKRTPDLELLRARAAELSPEAASALATRIDGVAKAATINEQLTTLDKSLKAIDSNTHALSTQLAQLNIPGAQATIAELKAGAITLAEAKDRAATLKSMVENLAAISPSLHPEVAQQLGAALDRISSASAAANMALVDVVNTQVRRAADIAEARDAIRILSAVVPDGTATSQLVKSASDQLMQVERAQTIANLQLESTRAVFANPSFEQRLAPVAGLLGPGRDLVALQDRAAMMDATSYRSFAAVGATLLMAGASFAYTSGGSPLGTISAQGQAAAVRNSESSLSIIAPSVARPADDPKVSNQAAFAPRTDAALSPLTQATMAINALRANVTTAQNWEQMAEARGFITQAYSPETVTDSVVARPIFQTRKIGSSISANGPDVKPRLVYPGFAQRQLNEMAAARRRGGLSSSFTDGLTGARNFGAGLTSANASGVASNGNSRIPTGLTRLLNREIISNGLDANGETGSGAQTAPTNQPPVTPVNDPSIIGTASAAAQPTAGASVPASIMPNQNKTSVAV